MTNITIKTDEYLKFTPERSDIYKIPIDSDEIECEIKIIFNATKGTPAYYDKDFGNWLPGDESEIEIEQMFEILPSGKEVEITKDDFIKFDDDIYDKLVEASL